MDWLSQHHLRCSADHFASGSATAQSKLADNPLRISRVERCCIVVWLAADVIIPVTEGTRNMMPTRRHTRTMEMTT